MKKCNTWKRRGQNSGCCNLNAFARHRPTHTKGGDALTCTPPMSFGLQDHLSGDHLMILSYS